MNKIKSFKIHTSDTEDDKVFLGKDLEPEIMFTEVLEILENNGYHIEIEYENTPTEKTIINNIDRPNVYFDGEKYYTILHEYYGDDEHDNRKAVVIRKEDSTYYDTTHHRKHTYDTYSVIMIKDGKIIEERLLKGHSEEYAENCAENFVMGIIYRGE